MKYLSIYYRTKNMNNNKLISYIFPWILLLYYSDFVNLVHKIIVFPWKTWTPTDNDKTNYHLSYVCHRAKGNIKFMIKPNNTHLYILTELPAPQRCCNHAAPPRALKASLEMTSGSLRLTKLQPRMNFSHCNHLWLHDLNSIQAESTTETCADLGHDDTPRLRRHFFSTVNLKCFQHHYQINFPGLHAGFPFI